MRKTRYITVKDLSKIYAIRLCPQFKDIKTIAHKHTEHHDKFLNEIKKKFEDEFKCSCEVERNVKSEEVSGRVDLKCESKDCVYVVEVKSYGSYKGSLSDAYQLLIYAAMLKNRITKPIRAFLVYRDCWIEFSWEFIEYFAKSVIQSESTIMNALLYKSSKCFLPGRWCIFCGNKCHYAKSMT